MGAPARLRKIVLLWALAVVPTALAAWFTVEVYLRGACRGQAGDRCGSIDGGASGLFHAEAAIRADGSRDLTMRVMPATAATMSPRS